MMTLNVFANLLAGKKAAVTAPVITAPGANVKKRPSRNAVNTGNNWLANTAKTNGPVAATVYDPSGKPLQLGEKDAKASGGEGTVYTLPCNNKFLVKLYKEETLKDPQKMREIRKRINDMVNLKKCASMPFLAWPLMPVCNSSREVIGFVMRKCGGNSFMALRGPKNIQKFFPNADRYFLAKIALDYVRKIKSIAGESVLVNDFNPANFLVDQNGNVSFIDCDSFQIPAGGNSVNISRTYFPSHAAPELLKNKSLLAHPRNIHQVEFGAALIVFHILMCGLPPYNYYDPKNRSACGTPDENLINGRCPLGTGAGCCLPPGDWYNMWSHLTYNLKSAFIATFREGHSDPAKRSSLGKLEWELKVLMDIMEKDPVRKQLIPATAKPRGDRESKTGFDRDF